MKRFTVRWRLTVAFAAVMAVVLSATGVFVYQRQASNLDQAINRSLVARAADVAALAQQSDTGLADARPRPGRANRLELAQLIDASGRVVDRTPGLPGRSLLSPTTIAAALRGPRVIAASWLSGDQPVRLLAEPVRAQDQRLVIVVGQSLEERNLALSDLGGVLLVGGPLALLLASGAGYLLTGAALRPVDAMLARIRASVERERALVSDASHELRTPLAVLRTELELIGRERPTGPALQSAIGSAIEETDRLSQLTDDLLLLARADNRQLAIGPIRISAGELLHQAAGRARRHPEADDRQITVDAADDIEVAADRDRTLQAIENLLTNALRHANTDIQLRAHRNGEFVELHVIDDGAGFPPDFLPHAWERFARADAGRTEGGAGLGLAIVRAIAEAHGGQAHATNGSAGGADVWITVPSASSSDHRGQATTISPPEISLLDETGTRSGDSVGVRQYDRGRVFGSDVGVEDLERGDGDRPPDGLRDDVSRDGGRSDAGERV
jgi:two-component system OmpR family sensor kinase